MRLSKKQWFGIITFILLMIAAYLVTKEPWKAAADNSPNFQIESDSTGSN